MKISLFALLMTLTVISCKKNNDASGPDVMPETDSTCGPLLQKTVVATSSSAKDSAWFQVPCHYYNQQAKDSTYPLLVYFNGSLEGSKYGNLNKLLAVGVPYFLKDSVRFTFNVGGGEEKMIVVCPQSATGFYSPSEVNNILNDIVSRYRVDVRRIYLTGISAGAHSIWSYLTDKPEYAARIAAAVPMSTVEIDDTHKAQIKYIAAANVHMKIFCGNNDNKYLSYNKDYSNLVNQFAAGLATFSTYPGAHTGWNNLYNLSHRYYNPNIYDWMLQFRK